MASTTQNLWCETCQVHFAVPDPDPSAPYRCARCQAFVARPELRDRPAHWLYASTPSGAEYRGEDGARTTWMATPEGAERQIRQRFASYEILAELGRGGMGVVYRAWDEAGGREVALKVLIGGRWADRTAVERFLREARAASKVSHPGLVRVYASGEWESQPWYAMELIEGPSLKELLDDSGRPPLEEAIRITAQLARAVQHAHELGISHRDIKPENVLLRVTGEPVLTDFGLVLEHHHARLTHTGQVMGTPAYLAPELARGTKAPDWPLVDIYALGALLYELLTGRPAYQGDSGMHVLMDVIEGPPPGPRTLVPEIPRAVEILVQRAMARLPSARIQTAGDLAEDLERAWAGMPIHAKPLSASYRTRLWVNRHGQTLAIVIGSFAVALGVVGIVAGARARMAADSRADAWEAANNRLFQLQPEWEALDRAGDRAAQDASFEAFVTGDRWRGAPALSDAWRQQAQRLRARGDAAGELVALGHAWSEASTEPTERAALDSLVEAMTARWWYDRVEALVGEEADSRSAIAAIARRDLRSARTAWDAQPEGAPPVAPLVTALLSGTRTEHSVGAVHPLSGGRLLLVGESVVEVAADAALTPIQTWDLGRRVDVAIPVGDHRVISWAAGRAELLERESGSWEVRTGWEVSRITDAVLLDGGEEPSVLVSAGYFSRQLFRLDREGARWTLGSAHDETNQMASDILALASADLRGDPRTEVLVLAGPWNAFDVRWLYPDDAGVLQLGARRKLGYASDVTTLTHQGAKRVAVIKADRYPSRRTFAVDRPYGEPAGLYILDPSDLRATDHRRLVAPVGSEPPDTGALVAADFDGDGLDDLATTATSERGPWTLLYRQTSTGEMLHARIAGMTVLHAVQADEDPAAELLVRVEGSGPDEGPAVWVLGAGDTPLPTLPAFALAQPPPPEDLEPSARRTWSRADKLASAGLFAAAAELFEEVARSPLRPSSTDRAWLRAATLWTAADRPLVAADVAGQVEAEDLRTQALDARADAYVRAYRFPEAQQTDAELERLDPPEAVRASMAARAPLYAARAVAAPTDLGFDRPLDPAWDIRQPLGVRRDPRAGQLTLDSITGLGSLASLPLDRTGEVLAIEITAEVERLEWGSGLEIALESVSGPGLAFEVSGWGGGALLERQMACRIGERMLVGPRVPAAPDDRIEIRVRIEAAPRLREVRCSIEGADGTVIFDARAPLDQPLPMGNWRLAVRSGGEEAVETPMHARVLVDGIGLRGASIRTGAPGEALGLAYAGGDLEAALEQAAPGVLRAALLAELGRTEEAQRELVLAEPSAPPADLALLLRSRPALANLLRPALGDAWFRVWHAAWNVAVVSHPDDPWLQQRLREDLEGLTAWDPTDPDGVAIRTELLANRGRAWWAVGRSTAARSDLTGATATAEAVIREAEATQNGPRLQSGRQVWMDSYAALAAIALSAGDETSALQHAREALVHAPFRQLAIDRLLLDPQVDGRRADPEWAAVLRP